MTQDFTLPFGKYRGQPLRSVPAKYLNWMMATLSPSETNDRIKEAIREYKKQIIKEKRKFKIECR